MFAATGDTEAGAWIRLHKTYAQLGGQGFGRGRQTAQQDGLRHACTLFGKAIAQLTLSQRHLDDNGIERGRLPETGSLAFLQLALYNDGRQLPRWSGPGKLQGRRKYLQDVAFVSCKRTQQNKNFVALMMRKWNVIKTARRFCGNF